MFSEIGYWLSVLEKVLLSLHFFDSIIAFG